MSVNKVSHFAAAMQEHLDKYVIIGGNACAVILSQYGHVFRPTDDLDLVILLEELDEAFANDLWSYIHDGDYEITKHTRKNGGGNVYRFTLDENSELRDSQPVEIELFSRKPEALAAIDDKHLRKHLVPIETADRVSNFSAILLDDDYYAFLLGESVNINGVRCANLKCLIVLKLLAWLGNRELFSQKEITTEIDVYKHIFDVMTLIAFLDDDVKIPVSKKMLNDIKVAIALLRDSKVTDELAFVRRELLVSFLDGANVLEEVFVED